MICLTGELERKKSPLRRELEDLLAEREISLEKRITVMNMETGEGHYFDDYAEAMQFLKGRKGRWYLATPGIRYKKRAVQGVL